MPSYKPLMLPVAATVWMSLMTCTIVPIFLLSLLYFAPGWSDCWEGLLNWWALVFSKGSMLCNNNRNQLLRLGFKPVAVLRGLPPKGSKSWFLNYLMQVVPWPRSSVASVACRQIICKRLYECSSFSECCLLFLSVQVWYERVRSTCVGLYI